MFARERELVSVELGDGFIKLAETAFFQGKREVTRLIKRPLTTEDPAGEIRGIFESLKIPFGPVRLNIPRHLVTVRFLKLPSTDDGEIKKMARIESFKYVPYADEETISGYRIIEKQDDGYSRIMIAVAQADTALKKTELLKRASLSVEFISLGSETLLLWYLAAREPGDSLDVLLVNIDAEHIDIDVVLAGRLVFTRGVSYTSAFPISTEKILEQINLSIVAYRKESPKPLDKVILSGIPARSDKIKTILSDSVHAPIEIFDQMKNVPRSSDAHLELEEASFIELLGLSLKLDKAEINLLPEADMEVQRLEIVKKNITTGLIVSALIIFIAFGVVLKKLHDKEAYLSYVDSEIGKISGEVKTARTMAKEIEIVTSKIAERPLAIDLVSEIFKITPRGITLTMMEYESHKAVTLRGSAANLSDVFKYVTILENSPYFADVKVKYANKRMGQASPSADFEIAAPVTKVK